MHGVHPLSQLFERAAAPPFRFYGSPPSYSLLTEVPARLWWQAEGCMVLEEVDFNYFTSRLQNRRAPQQIAGSAGEIGLTCGRDRR